MPSSIPDVHIPRPLNAFFLYRRDVNKRMKAIGEQSHQQTQVSKAIGMQWQEESPQVRMKYEKLAKSAQEEHKRMYPNYRFEPGKNKPVARRTTKKERVAARPVVPPPTPLPQARRSPVLSFPDATSSSHPSSGFSPIRAVPYTQPELRQSIPDWLPSTHRASPVSEEQSLTRETLMDDSESLSFEPAPFGLSSPISALDEPPMYWRDPRNDQRISSPRPASRHWGKSVPAAMFPADSLVAHASTEARSWFNFPDDD